VEAPHLKALHEKYAQKGLKILAINAWDEDREMVGRFVADQKLPYMILMKGRSVFRDKYNGRTIPKNFLVDSSGNIVLDQNGWDESQMVSKIEELLR
jgi:thiol-disulfide isomerase/thioredoxin